MLYQLSYPRGTADPYGHSSRWAMLRQRRPALLVSAPRDELFAQAAAALALYRPMWFVTLTDRPYGAGAIDNQERGK